MKYNIRQIGKFKYLVSQTKQGEIIASSLYALLKLGGKI